MRTGYAVQITGIAGNKWLSYAGQGLLPAVWTLSQRKLAVEHKRELIDNGFKAKVVRVTFADPEVAA